MVSLEAHIDRLHSQLLGLNLYPIPIEDLRPYKGLNCKTAKVISLSTLFDRALSIFKTLPPANRFRLRPRQPRELL